MLKPKKDPLGLGFLIIKPNKTHNYLGFFKKRCLTLKSDRLLTVFASFTASSSLQNYDMTALFTLFILFVLKLLSQMKQTVYCVLGKPFKKFVTSLKTRS